MRFAALFFGFEIKPIFLPKLIMSIHIPCLLRRQSSKDEPPRAVLGWPCRTVLEVLGRFHLVFSFLFCLPFCFMFYFPVHCYICFLFINSWKFLNL